MRINLKFFSFLLCVVACCVTVIIWSQCKLDRDLPNTFREATEDIGCQINGQYTIECKKVKEEVYLPYSFIHSYFDISGKIVKPDKKVEKFELNQCTSKIFYPKNKYDPKGVFTSFENFKVEERDRVKCVSGYEGVPVSTQWNPIGYFYPTQIAQFGLSHYSKNLSEVEPRRKILEDGDSVNGDWFVPNVGCYAGRQYNQLVNSYVLNFHTDEKQSITLSLDHTLDFVLKVTLSILSNSSLTVSIKDLEKKETWRLHYVCSNDLIRAKDQDIYYGIGCNTTWQTLVRDLLVDVQKGVFLLNRPKLKLLKSNFKVKSINLQGSGSIDNLTLSTSEHIAQFYASAEWLVNHQDHKTGGWPNPVKRIVTTGINDLPPGWYSAMGQGHAISVLSRAYHHSGRNEIYLNAAKNALKVFSIRSKDGGVLAKFLDKYPWYEEYPTTPSMFILNGFMYSLIGLYDLIMLGPKSKQKEAQVLYDQGMNSLKHMLLLYDTGSGSKYDLRHLSLGIAPKIARCDYHATHINQLLLLSTIDNDPVISNTAHRWAGYMVGKRASHN